MNKKITYLIPLVLITACSGYSNNTKDIQSKQTATTNQDYNIKIDDLKPTIKALEEQEEFLKFSRIHMMNKNITLESCNKKDIINIKHLKDSFYLTGGKTGIGRRLSLDNPSLTLTCSAAQKQTERCHPIETRPLQIREYARIQTFPDNWEFIGSTSSVYKQIGNAVSVNFAHILACSIVKLLNDMN